MVRIHKTNLPIIFRNYISGLIISNTPTDTEHSITISDGVCTSKDNSTYMELNNTLTKQIDDAWIPGDNVGGFPSGLTLSADTWYHMFVIYNPITDTVDAGFDTDVNATNLLSDATGYTEYKWVGAVKTDGSSNIEAFSCYEEGDMIRFVRDNVNEGNVSGTTSSTSITFDIPIDITVRPIISINSFNSADINSRFVFLSGSDGYEIRVGRVFDFSETTVATTESLTTTNRQIYVRNDDTETSTTVYSHGFITNRSII
jgi:hypothetical protein